MEKKTYAQTQEEALMIEQENKDKIERYATFQAMRAQSHKKNLPAPIIKDKEGRLHWLNRAQRRKAKI